MISTTLKDYKDNYQTNLDKFLKEYEDNTKSIFLQNELEKYNYFLDLLIKHKNNSEKFTFQILGEYLEELNPEFIGVDFKKPNNYITSTKRIIEFITEKINPKSANIETNINVSDTKYKSTFWFKVGLLFAKGELNKYYNSNKTGFKNRYSAPKVAKEIGLEDAEKNILATINNYPLDNVNADKNIYNSKDKMDKIIKHCNENQITIDDYFLSRLPVE